MLASALAAGLVVVIVAIVVVTATRKGTAGTYYSHSAPKPAPAKVGSLPLTVLFENIVSCDGPTLADRTSSDGESCTVLRAPV